MNILIVRTFGSMIDASSYNVQETGLAKAWVRAGHQADVVLYGGFKDDRTVLMPVDDTGVVRYDEDLLGDDAYVAEGMVDSDGQDRFISVYYLGGFSILKNGFFFSLREMSRNYDVIQVNEYDQISSWLYYTDKRLRDKVVIYHGPYYHDFNRGYNLKCRIFDHTFLKLKKAPDTVCYAKSEGAAEFLRAKGFKNVTAVGVGIDTDVWEDILDTDGMASRVMGSEYMEAVTRAEGIANAQKADGRDEDGISRPFTYMYMGKIEPRRNSVFLADVVNRILSQRNDARFILIGNGEPEYRSRVLGKLKKWMDLGRVIYVKSVSQEQVPYIYTHADCMLFPSIYEIFGMVLSEAAYFGLPVITSDNGGASILYENGRNAIVTEDLTLDTWVSAALKMHDDVDMRNGIRVALLEDKERLTWDNVVRRMMKTCPGIRKGE